MMDTIKRMTVDQSSKAKEVKEEEVQFIFKLIFEKHQRFFQLFIL